MKTLFHFIILFLLLPSVLLSQNSNDKVTPLSIGETKIDSLTSKSAHIYTVELDSTQFVFGHADQKTVDVVISVIGPKDERIGRFDYSARSKDTFQFDTESAGTYRIEITPFEEEEGTYSLSIDHVEPVPEEPAARVDQLMMEYTGDDVPGGSVMVMKDGEVIFQEEYGMANLTYDIPFQNNTLHNIGSTSKQFTAFAILLLAEQGKLSLDDDIRQHIPELPVFEDTVRLRHLLSHTSGYREYLNTLSMTGRDISSQLGMDKIIEIVQNQPELQNKPGDEWNYNNTGFALMSEVVKRTTDTPFPQWMKENLFEPLEMNQTVVRASPGQVVDHRSTGYGRSDEGIYEAATDIAGAMGAGGMYTTMDDLQKWVNHLIDPKIGNKMMIDEMTNPFVLNDGDTTNYGLGLFVGEYKGLDYFHHGGADVAHRSMLMVFPEIDAAVITQSNNAGFSGNIPNRVADTFFKEYWEEEVEQTGDESKEDAVPFEYDPENFEPLTGRYELEIQPGFILTFDRDGNRIYTQATNQPEIDLTATSDSTFSLAGVDASITFHLNEDQSADSLTLHQNGQHIAHKVEWNPSISELDEFSGRYFSEEIQTMYNVAVEDSNLVLKNYQMNDMELNPGNIDEFSAGFPMGSLEFQRSETGDITGFKASNGRTRGVHFEKREVD
jgi:CubicO group peptidase (beta-lactamase class C family)